MKTFILEDWLNEDRVLVDIMNTQAAKTSIRSYSCGDGYHKVIISDDPREYAKIPYSVVEEISNKKNEIFDELVKEYYKNLEAIFIINIKIADDKEEYKGFKLNEINHRFNNPPPSVSLSCIGHRKEKSKTYKEMYSEINSNMIERGIVANIHPVVNLTNRHAYAFALKHFVDDIKTAVAPSYQLIRTRNERFQEQLQKERFFSLEKVKNLTEEGKIKLVTKIAANKMPYGIAMFEYLGFCEFLDYEKGTKKKTAFFLSKLYNEKAKCETSARHLRNNLQTNNKRYTSHLHKETVKNDYNKLK